MKLTLFAASVLLIAAPLVAQGPSPEGRPPAPDSMPRRFEGGFGMMRQAVTNAPYSATFTNTFTEKLQDGTVLTHTTTRVAARDSLGRTREEITMAGSGGDATPRTMVVIFDPVAKTVTHLNAETKTATVRTLPERRGFGEGRGHDGPPSAPPPMEGKGPRGDREKNVVVTDLGSKTISGVLVTGKRVTKTVPANTIGNSAAIVSTHEEWYSPDLKIEVSRMDVNPFRGTDSVTASGLTKAEPAAALFQVPQGYTVATAPEHGFGRGRRHDVPPPPPPSGM